MTLGVLTNLLGGMSLREALEYLRSIGVESLELGCGGYPGKAHCDPKVLLNDEKAFEEFKATIEEFGMPVKTLSVHGNPVHPDKEKAAAWRADFRDAVLLAEKLGVDTVVTFSGCPGDCPESKHPNWVTCPWPEDFLEILDYQWNEVLIPYWMEEAEFCKSHGLKHIAFEMHPGFCVYNPETLLRLRNAVGDIIGANFDPSHLIWQGIDPVAAVRALSGAIYHFHAKDTCIDKYNTAVNGVLDTKHYGDELHRSWVFRAVGYGNSEEYWRKLISELKLGGYDGIISIEHEDSYMTSKEGLEKAVSFLSGIIIRDPKPSTMHWA